MTMNFDVSPSVALDGIEPGQTIHFSMVETPGGGWLIDQVHVMGSAAAGDEHDDD